MADISYKTVMNVLMSWDSLKAVPNYEERAGELIFRRIFEIEPTAKGLFQFKEVDNYFNHPQYLALAKIMVDMIDMTMGFLGPDLEPLADDLQALGKRHIKYGVPSEFFPIMERAVVYALDELLHEKFTKEDRHSWELIFHFIISHMVIGMKSG